MKQKETEKKNKLHISFCMAIIYFYETFYRFLHGFVSFWVLFLFFVGWVFGSALILRCVVKANLAAGVSGRRKCILTLSLGVCSCAHMYACTCAVHRSTVVVFYH